MIRYRLVLWTETQPIEEKDAKAVFNDFGEAVDKNSSYSPISGRVDSLFPRGEGISTLSLEWKLTIVAITAIVLLAFAMTFAGASQFLVWLASTPALLVSVFLFILAFRTSAKRDFYEVHLGTEMKWDGGAWRY